MVFSIIIPVYNNAKYLSKCLDSALLQNYLYFEVICINDGSTDGSLAILKKYQSQYSNLKIISIENNGVSNARNLGLQQAIGDYILFLDSDDYYYHTNVLSELNELINQSKNVDCIYFSGGCSTPEWQGTEYYQNQIYNSGWDCLSEHCCKPKLLVFGAVYAHCFKRLVLIQNHILFNTNLTYGEDRLFVIEFMHYAGETIVYSEPLYCYNVHNGTLMTADASQKKAEQSLLFTVYLWNFLMRHNIKSNISIYKYLWGIYVSGIINLYKIGIHSKIDLRMLFTCAIGWKRIVKSILLCLNPKMYQMIINLIASNK